MTTLTDHSAQIAHARELAAHSHSEARITHLTAAAALLECHDATGISLDNWKPVRDFVELWLGPIQENGV